MGLCQGPAPLLGMPLLRPLPTRLSQPTLRCSQQPTVTVTPGDPDSGIARLMAIGSPPGGRLRWWLSSMDAKLSDEHRHSVEITGPPGLKVRVNVEYEHEGQYSEVETRVVEIPLAPRCQSICRHHASHSRRELISPVHEDVVLTARSLFLNQVVSYFDIAPTRGTYVADLHITDEDLRRWRGCTILDVAGGASVFPEEAWALGIKVVVVDLNHKVYATLRDEKLKKSTKEGLAQGQEDQEDHDILALRRYHDLLAHLYVRNLETLVCRGIDPPESTKEAFAHIFLQRKQIASGFYQEVQRMSGDATRLKIEDDSFDVVFNCWMLNYLDEKGRFNAMVEFIRVTKHGGEVRIVAGNENADGSQRTAFYASATGSALDDRRIEAWAEKVSALRSLGNHEYEIKKIKKRFKIADQGRNGDLLRLLVE